MPKSKKARVPNHNHHDRPRGESNNSSQSQSSKKGRKMNTFSKLSTSSGKSNTNANAKQKNPQQQQQKQQRRPVIPFGKKDRILLIGEGDFSFARSLVVQHRCRNVLATCYDPKETLCEKYPQVEKNLQNILTGFSRRGRKTGENVETSQKNDESKHKNHGPNALFSVDARKLGLSAGGGKDVRTGFARTEPKLPAWRTKQNPQSSSSKGGPWDLICFNFPHVGGLSTDVNRQVRANQELLVAFFKACVPLLSAPPELPEEDEEEWEFSDETESESDEDDQGNAADEATQQSKSKTRTEPGQILVTLFEGEPYTLWNIRDLARHAGFRVVTSFMFPWSSYQGYSHARTLGEVESKHGGRGGWRGENREARMYVFELKQEEHGNGTKTPLPSKTDAGAKKKKRTRNESDSDDSD